MKTINRFCFLLAFLTFSGSMAFSQEKSNIRFAVFSDPHYFDPELGTEGKAFEDYLDNDRKLLRESPALLRSAIKNISGEDVSFVLVPGDLTKDGELTSHKAFAAYMSELEALGREVFVIPGNHDVNNPEAFAFRGEEKLLTETVSAADFARIYGPFGYDIALYRDPASLSYIAEPVDGLWLLALDACRYDENMHGGHPVTDGRIRAETLAWLTEKLSSIEASGKLVIAMMHHGIIEHYAKQDKFFGEYVVDDYKAFSEKLAELGVRLVFTGHYHAQDVVVMDFGNGAKLYDVETGSLVTYPCPYRLVDLSANKAKIETKYVVPDGFEGDFKEYSRHFVWSGIEGIAHRTLVEMKLKEDEAALLSGQVADAFVAHYQGDEISPERPFNLKGVGLLGRFYISFKKKLVWNLYNDLEPADNNLEITF